MSTVIVFFLLFLVPFIIAPFGITQFEDPKVIAAQGGILLLFIVQIFRSHHKIDIRLLPLVIFSIVFVLTFIDIIFFRTDISFFGNAFRMQGIFLLWLLMFFSYFSASISLRRIPFIVFSLLLLIEFVALFFLPLNESQRYVGTIGEPNALGAFTLFVWPFAFFSIKKFGKKEGICMVLTLLLVGGIIYFSGSKSAGIGLVIQLLFLLLYKLGWSLKKVFIVCLGLYVLSYLLPFFQAVPYENRTEIWRSAIAAGNSRPILGWGFGNIEYAMHAAAAKIDVPVQYYYIDSAHNIFLDWYVAGGIVGLLCIVILVIQTVFGFLQKTKYQHLVLFLGILTTLSFNPASVVGLLGFWWIIGQGLFEHPQDKIT